MCLGIELSNLTEYVNNGIADDRYFIIQYAVLR